MSDAGPHGLLTLCNIGRFRLRRLCAVALIVQRGRRSAMALELRPNCECCDKDLPPSSPLARICSYECTFCADCVERVLFNVCPNCGGGFTRLPMRPATERRHGLSLAHRAPSTQRT